MPRPCDSNGRVPIPERPNRCFCPTDRQAACCCIPCRFWIRRLRGRTWVHPARTELIEVEWQRNSVAPVCFLTGISFTMPTLLLATPPVFACCNSIEIAGYHTERPLGFCEVACQNFPKLPPLIACGSAGLSLEPSVVRSSVLCVPVTMSTLHMSRCPACPERRNTASRPGMTTSQLPFANCLRKAVLITTPTPPRVTVPADQNPIVPSGVSISSNCACVPCDSVIATQSLLWQSLLR